MYYKIKNKECEVYKQLHEMRLNELKIEKENVSAICEKTGLTFDNYLGLHGQQNFNRVAQYDGFEFLETEKVDLKIWKRHPQHLSIWIPNKRTKQGREMDQFISNGLRGSVYNQVFKILKCKHHSKFVLPYVEVCKEIVLIYLGEDYDLIDENIIEITKKEFYSILEQAKS